MSALPRKKLFALVGENQKNPDGRHRQAILQSALPGEPISLVREPGNPHVSNCVLACDNGGNAVGSLSREDAAIIAPLLDRGFAPSAFIHQLTGGLPDYPNFGCVISIVWEGRSKPAPRRLKGDQQFYEHAPTWEAEGSPRKSIKPRKTSGVIRLVKWISRVASK